MFYMHYIDDSTQAEMMEPVSCTEVSSDATFVISPSRSPLQMEDDKDKVSSTFLLLVYSHITNTWCIDYVAVISARSFY